MNTTTQFAPPGEELRHRFGLEAAASAFDEDAAAFAASLGRFADVLDCVRRCFQAATDDGEPETAGGIAGALARLVAATASVVTEPPARLAA